MILRGILTVVTLMNRVGVKVNMKKVIQRWKILPTASGDATTMWKKQKVENEVEPFMFIFSQVYSETFSWSLWHKQ